MEHTDSLGLLHSYLQISPNCTIVMNQLIFAMYHTIPWQIWIPVVWIFFIYISITALMTFNIRHKNFCQSSDCPLFVSHIEAIPHGFLNGVDGRSLVKYLSPKISRGGIFVLTKKIRFRIFFYAFQIFLKTILVYF